MRRPAIPSGYAALPRRTPGWPLLLTLGLHLLLAWSWRSTHPSAHDTREERVFDLIPLPPDPPLPAADRALPRSDPAPAPARPAPRSAAPAIVLSEPEPISVPAEQPAAVADPFAVAPEPPAPESPLDAMVGRARRDAGGIDRALRKGKPGVPAEPDTPMGRFVRALEGAHKDTSRTLVTDSYTAPDGEIIYRFRHGGKVWCRTSGNVRPDKPNAGSAGPTQFDSAGGGGFAGLIRCPSHGEWKRD